jgi:hypothetical protein
LTANCARISAQVVFCYIIRPMNCQKRVPSFFLLQELQKEIPVSPLAPLAKGSWRRSA